MDRSIDNFKLYIKKRIGIDLPVQSERSLELFLSSRKNEIEKGKIGEYLDRTIKQGFDKDTAKKMVIQTFLGACMLAESSDLSLSELRKMVTSPGGTTEAGLKFLDTNRISEIIDGTIKVAKDKSIELGKK